MNAKVIGVGAAGGKAAISLIENGIMNIDDVLIINSTLKDVPEAYRSIAIQFSNSNGCAKERDIAKELCLASIQDNTLARLDSLMDPTDDLVIIVNSSEGGTGCGASPIIAQYMKNVVETNVHMFVFTGFEEDGRGMKNTVEYFQELSNDYVVEAISNKKFLNCGNKLKAEKAANDEFTRRVSVLLGQLIVDSDHNIDDKDLYKATNIPGFMDIGYRVIEKIKSVSMFNDILTDMIDNTKSLEINEPSAKIIAVILNITNKSRDFIDYEFNVIKNRFGTPYDIFTHVQMEGSVEFIAFIVSGMAMPIDEVKDIYDRYLIASEKVNKKKDEFLDMTKGLVGNQEDSMFNMKKQSTSSKIDVNKKNFLKNFNLESNKPQPASDSIDLKPTIVRMDNPGFQTTKTKNSSRNEY
ncbi:MAG: hypothetical protein M0P49_03340 [Bacilli bacterium]|nr:hypothetical protein [Bacilli bacterium]